ncbi:MAG: MucB/RseB C-terminal domain-containing protein [Gammaproteobacteria bacterium]
MTKAPIVLLGLLLAGSVIADDAEHWLEKMDRAAQTLSYQGDFVFLRGHRMRHMQAQQLIDDSGVHLRIIAVDGPAAKLVATRSGTASAAEGYYQNPPARRDILFPSAVPSRLIGLRSFYSFSLAGTGRVADRPTRIIDAKPNDDFRFGFRLWADNESGLLLKVAMVNTQGEAVEQFSFSRIDMNPDRQQLAESIFAESPVADPVVMNQGGAIEQLPWEVTAIPSGFSLQGVRRTVDERQRPVDHLIYSDGLATVSVFIEPLKESRGGQQTRSTARIAGITAMTDVIADNQVTVIGEVPAATLRLIMNSVKAPETAVTLVAGGGND